MRPKNWTHATSIGERKDQETDVECVKKKIITSTLYLTWKALNKRQIFLSNKICIKKGKKRELIFIKQIFIRSAVGTGKQRGSHKLLALSSPFPLFLFFPRFYFCIRTLSSDFFFFAYFRFSAPAAKDRTSTKGTVFSFVGSFCLVLPDNFSSARLSYSLFSRDAYGERFHFFLV